MPSSVNFINPLYISGLSSFSAQNRPNTPTTPSPWGYFLTFNINGLIAILTIPPEKIGRYTCACVRSTRICMHTRERMRVERPRVRGGIWLGVWGYLSNFLISSIKNIYKSIACGPSPIPPLNWGYSGGSGGICGVAPKPIKSASAHTPHLSRRVRPQRTLSNPTLTPSRSRQSLPQRGQPLGASGARLSPRARPRASPPPAPASPIPPRQPSRCA